jgi:branched-chain amino acid aminotransferase
MTAQMIPAGRKVGHGDLFTAHMVSADWTTADGWTEPELRPLENLSLHPATIGLHYGQVVFEGLKAHPQADGSIAVFRPGENARRFARSAARLAMPVLPEELFLRSVDQLVAADAEWLPPDPDLSLYLRPLMFATEANLMLRASNEYRYLLMAFVAGGFFGETAKPVSVWVCHDQSRAMPGGTGNVKCAANYGPSLVAQRRAQAAGCQQVIWLDAVEHRWIEEMGGMNLFFVRGSGAGAELITPELTGTLLPGVTRDSLITLGRRLGHRVTEGRMSIDALYEGCATGEITEVFACGTAAVVTAVGEIRDEAGAWTVGDGKTGPVTEALRGALLDLHHGIAADPDGWMHRVP